MAKQILIKDKTFDFALKIVNMHKQLTLTKKEFVIS